MSYEQPRDVFDSMGRKRPQNEQEAVRMAENEFLHIQRIQKHKQLQQLKQLQEMQQNYQKFMEQEILRQREEEANKIDYLGELDAKQRDRKARQQSNLVPQSIHDLYDRYAERAEAIEQKQAEREKLLGKNNNNKKTDDKSTTKETTTTKTEFKPLPQTRLVASLSETRSPGEIKMYYDHVIDLWHKTFPKRSVPNLTIKIQSDEGFPMATNIIGGECHLTSLTLGVTPRALRKLFVKATPDYVESEQRLIDATDSMYFTPERIQFVLAKSLSQVAVGGPNNLGAWAKLKFFKRFSGHRYNLTRERIEMKSDTMAAHLAPHIAIGGIEHLAKLNSFYEHFQHDISLEDDAVVADVRLMNLLNVAETVHGIKKADALRLSLNNRVTLSGNSQNLVSTVTRNLDSRLLQSHIAEHYPKIKDGSSNYEV